MRFKRAGYAALLWLLVGLSRCVPASDAPQATWTPTFIVPTPTRKPMPTLPIGALQATPASSGTRQGDPAPDFTLDALSGERVSLSQFRGQPVLINFWAVWCAFCRFEMPDIQRVYDEYQDEGLVVLGVNVGEDVQTITAFVQEMGITFPVLFDHNAQVMRSYRMRGLPATVVIDLEGVIHTIHLGLIEYQEIIGYLEQMGVSS